MIGIIVNLHAAAVRIYLSSANSENSTYLTPNHTVEVNCLILFLRTLFGIALFLKWHGFVTAFRIS